ncbi:MAG: HAD-IA family hydrolase, partial [Acidimicrobiales bacterium]
MILQPLLDAVLVDLGGTVVVEAPPGTPVTDLQVELRPGVLDDLRAIAADVRLGAVTNTTVMVEAEVRALLVDAGVDELLEVLVTSVDAGTAKPHPAPLELALRRLGLDDPSRVLYVGDQPTDAEAAEAAGMPYADIDGGTIALAISSWVERSAGSRFEAARGAVVPTDCTASSDAGSHQARLTKPPGSLGRLEAASMQLAAIARVSPPPVPDPAVIAVFAADHGVLASGVSPWPQEVTAQMVANFTTGGAAVNVLARHAGAQVDVIDVGVATPLLTEGGVFRRRVASGTADLSQGPAMTRIEALLALDVGAELAGRAIAGGAGCLITGDMGIGNTTPSAALIAAITGRPPVDVTGRGAGADDVVLARKVAVIESALER